METKIQNLGKLDSVKLFFDPLRKEDSFLIVRSGEVKMGFVIKDEIILETNFDFNWEEVTSIIGGFSSLETFQKIKEKVNEQTK